MDVGRNLTLTSEQDTDNYDSKQQSASAGGSVSMSGGSGSLNLSRDKMHSTYESVLEQTGIFAGKGGFDITVGEHTQLNGAVIGSTAAADKNTLDTGTLGFSDIKNSAEFEVEHLGMGISSGGSIGGQFAGNMANGLLAGVNGTGSALQQGIQAATAAVQGLAGGNVGAAISGAASPYLAEQIHKLTEGNPEANLMAHAVVGAVVAQASGNSALAGAAGAATASAATSVIAKTLYGTDDYSKLDETQKQTISALSTLASGLAGGLAGDSTASAVAGAQAGKNTSENNDMFSLPSGLNDYGSAASTLGTSMTESGASTEEINAALSKNAKGDLPEGANITKAIVDGYKDGVLIAGAWYLGPAASLAKAVGGATIAEIANGTYQWFDLSRPGNENKTWDYKGSISTGITGALAPGRGVWQNVGIAAGGAVFTDGPDIGSVGGAALGAWAGGKFGELAPFPGEVNDLFGGIGGEIISNKVKDKINEN